MVAGRLWCRTFCLATWTWFPCSHQAKDKLFAMPGEGSLPGLVDRLLLRLPECLLGGGILTRHPAQYLRQPIEALTGLSLYIDRNRAQHRPALLHLVL